MKDTFNCLAIDMGAGSIRIMLGAVSRNKFNIREVYRFNNEIINHGEHDRWNISGIEKEIIEGINKAYSIEKNILSIGIDCWGVDFVLLDKNDQLLELPVAYRDNRTKGMDVKWEQVMKREETFLRTGINFYIYNTLFQLLSLQNSELIGQAARLLFIPDYIGFLLSRRQYTDLTIASTSQMLSAHAKIWDDEILKNLGLNNAMFADIVEPGEIIGKINHPLILGINASLTSVCGHDTASAVMAVPAEKPGFAFISTGTWCIVGTESKMPVISGEALKNGFTNERGYDGTYLVMKNIVGLWLIQGLQRSLADKLTYSDMEILAENTDSDLLVDPDDVMFYNPDNMKRAFDLYFHKTGQHIPSKPGEYIRCAYNSLCWSFRYHIEKLEMLLNRKIDTVHLIGGGCQSKYLCKNVSLFTGRKVVSGPVEAATIGNIMTQAIAHGAVGNFDKGREMIRRSFETIDYDESRHMLSADSYRKFINLK